MHYLGAHSNGFQRAGMWGIVALQEIRRWVALSRSRSQIHVINFTIQKPNITNVINHRATKKEWPINSRYMYTIIFCNTETKICKCLKPKKQTKEMTLIIEMNCTHWNVYSYNYIAWLAQRYPFFIMDTDIYLFCLFSYSQSMHILPKASIFPLAPLLTLACTLVEGGGQLTHLKSPN